ncbi:uncharacterized protein LOC108984101 [Juglans regia]|uniref:Uncharacterized protein LOC108984101 n=1 Tax=Juglans regia TaxID=51240 RepID=A0A6P9DYJ9_JUGRE|nr:uncharacterized protein LOC108984101 [Juglans regia]
MMKWRDNTGDEWGNGDSPVKKWSGRLWTRRNHFIFKNQFIRPSLVLKLAASDIDLFKVVSTDASGREENGAGSHDSTFVASYTTGAGRVWKAPAPGWMKVNLDAGFDKIQQHMGLGIVIRDCLGDVQMVLSAPRSCVPFAYLDECYALLRAVTLCHELGFEPVKYESDAKMVVEAINADNSDFLWLGQIIEDIRHIMAWHPTWKLSLREETKLLMLLQNLLCLWLMSQFGWRRDKMLSFLVLLLINLGVMK